MKFKLFSLLNATIICASAPILLTAYVNKGFNVNHLQDYYSIDWAENSFNGSSDGIKSGLKIYEENSFSIEILKPKNHLKPWFKALKKITNKNTYIFKVINKKINISKQLFFKTTEEILNNDSLYIKPQFKNMVIENIKHHIYQVPIKHTISAANFFLLLDANQNSQDGSIIKNDHVYFRSSWGVWNGANRENEINYQITTNSIKRHLGLENNRNIFVKSFTPHKLGLLPSAIIYKVPIQESHYETTEISIDNYSQHYSLPANIKIDLPDGHSAGTEWWKGITSFLGIIGAQFKISCKFQNCNLTI